MVDQETYQAEDEGQKTLGPITPELKKEIFAELNTVFEGKHLSMNNDDEGQFEADLEIFIEEYRIEDRPLLEELIEEYREKLRKRIVDKNNKTTFGT